jgi:hypothetical protein
LKRPVSYSLQARSKGNELNRSEPIQTVSKREKPKTICVVSVCAACSATVAFFAEKHNVLCACLQQDCTRGTLLLGAIFGCQYRTRSRVFLLRRSVPLILRCQTRHPTLKTPPSSNALEIEGSSFWPLPLPYTPLHSTCQGRLWCDPAHLAGWEHPNDPAKEDPPDGCEPRDDGPVMSQG